MGRVLLNAFNAWEYGWKNNRADLKENAAKVFDTYLAVSYTHLDVYKRQVFITPKIIWQLCILMDRQKMVKENLKEE